TVHYVDNALPVAPRSLDAILAAAAARLGPGDGDELAFLADAFGQLPPATASRRASDQRRHRDKAVLRRLLCGLCARDAQAARAIAAGLEEANAAPVALDALLERQNYRLSYWRSAERELGYRRFFDINSLVGMHTEDERVFEDTHRLVLRWLAEGT